MIINATKKMHARRKPDLSISSTSYSQLSPSITSATFLSPRVASQRHLLGRSPPPSPSLPSLIPRHGKKPTSSVHSRLVKRLLIGFCGVTILVWLIVRQLYFSHSGILDLDSDDGGDYELVGDSSLPQEPSAIMVTDAKGNSKWTVSIPVTYEFPLKPTQYQEICSQSMELSKQLRSNSLTKHMLGYYQQDKNFLDVQDAEDQGLLPTTKGSSRPKGFVDDASMANHKSASNGLKVCDRSLTYVMETADAGFGMTLLRLWMSYGLAKKEHRAFFIDDTRWPYGKYSTYFAPPPAISCIPPPKTHIIPCPHSARHILVSAATAHHTFGHAFTEQYEDATKMEVQRQAPIFALLREGYEALFHLRPDDSKYVARQAEELYGATRKAGGMAVGMHVRRGDAHPYEYQYSKDYIPLDRYIDAARRFHISPYESSIPAGKYKSKLKKNKKRTPDTITNNGKEEKQSTPPTLILASDDPDIYLTAEMSGAVRAQDRIILATKTTLEAASGRKNPWIDEISGWEGGFYRDVFWSLGRPVGNALDINQLDNNDVPEGALRLRELVGRAYLLDLAVLGRADVVVCTVSSAGCRILAVMLGWERAVIDGEWRNVDGEFEWRGIV
ncbi:hypothetical protein GQ43DRAFT_19354 [Delitschia confertaspora ATCC 74209]|uniref:Uncharacterized protein n=1 Tax=Delitschia confertaspora ATCC 74209 TaxID=1513339 RepID=A0A9P4JSN8_9PLEO|nr:hypothetical protein GQ43DRAFT_19354 [Delitschia confertaspora ATCC 74209]